MSNSYIVQHPHHLVGKYLYCPEKMPADTRQPDTRFAVIKRKILISNSPVSLDDVLCGEQGHFLLDTAGASLLSPRYLALCGHVFHWPVFTRDTSLYGRHTWSDAQSFIILHWVTLTSFPLFIVSIKQICVSLLLSFSPAFQLHNPHHKSALAGSERKAQLGSNDKISSPNMKLCHRLVCGRSLILFYRLCAGSVFYHLFSFPPPQSPHGWKKDINLIQRPVGGTGWDGQTVLFH